MNTKNIYRCIAWIAIFLGLLIPAIGTDDIRINDTADRVREILGPPDGYMASGTRELWTYRRGRVEIVDGHVTTVDLVSEEEALLREQQKTERLRLQQERLQREHEARRAEGEQLKEKMLSDPDFSEASAATQIAFWKEFRRRYPSLSVETEYQQALVRRQAEIEDQRLQQKIQDLENRVANAETDARLAHERAAEAERQSQNQNHYSYYGWPIVTYPIYPSYPNCPGRPNRPRPPVISPIVGTPRVGINFGGSSSSVRSRNSFKSPYSPWPQAGSHRTYHHNSTWVEGSGAAIHW